MSATASLITCVSIVCSRVCSDADQRKYQISASLAFVRGIHRRPKNSPHLGPVTRKKLPFDDVIMAHYLVTENYLRHHFLKNSSESWLNLYNGNSGERNNTNGNFLLLICTHNKVTDWEAELTGKSPSPIQVQAVCIVFNYMHSSNNFIEENTTHKIHTIISVCVLERANWLSEDRNQFMISMVVS